MNLKACVEAKKCRKGPSTGTTKRGAFWLACEPVIIRSYGGDGIGNSGADCTNYLQLRHYRDGSVSAVVHGHYWHQNGASPDQYMQIPKLMECSTVEEVVVGLKGESFPEGDSVYSDCWEDKLTEALTSLGLEEAELAPDEVAAE